MTATLDVPLETTPPITQLEEMKVIKTRKKRAPKHDFKDGSGRVFAHKHDNGGGWVADTAKVADDVYVGPRCQIFNYASVSGKVKLHGRVKVFGHSCVHGAWQRSGILLTKDAMIFGAATVRDDVSMTDTARVSGNACVSGTSRLFNNANATESAQVVSTTLMGNCIIRGGAMLIRSHIDHNVTIENNAVVCGSTLNGFVRVCNFGQVINSRITNHLRETWAVVMDHAIILDNSGVFYPIIFKQHAVVVRSSINVRSSDMTNFVTPEVGNQTVIAGLTFSRRDELDAYMQRVAAAGRSGYAAPVSAVPVAAPGVARVNHLETPRNNRRIMALQDTPT